MLALLVRIQLWRFVQIILFIVKHRESEVERNTKKDPL